MSEKQSKKEATFKVVFGTATRRIPIGSEEEEIYMQWHGRVGVFSDSMTDIRQAMELLGLDTYEILDTAGRQVLWRSPTIIEYVEQRDAKKAKWEKEAHDLLAAFNELPLLIQEWKFGDLVIKLTRTKGEFNKNSGLRIRSDVDFVIYENERLLHGEGIRTEDYISSDGKILAKKFRSWNSISLFKDYFDVVIPKLKEMYDAENKFRAKWRM